MYTIVLYTYKLFQSSFRWASYKNTVWFWGSKRWVSSCDLQRPEAYPHSQDQAKTQWLLGYDWPKTGKADLYSYVKEGLCQHTISCNFGLWKVDVIHLQPMDIKHYRILLSFLCGTYTNTLHEQYFWKGTTLKKYLKMQCCDATTRGLYAWRITYEKQAQKEWVWHKQFKKGI